jgi:ubiquinone/menaquinone biosynthesis C-methylase UbiE
MNFYQKETKTAFQAKEEAQRIAFAPMLFQAARVLRNSGILRVIEDNNQVGLTETEVVEKVKLPPYGVRVLLEAGLGIGLLLKKDEKYKVTKLGYFILNDELTRVNMDFMHDVCYQGAFYLDKCIETGKPEGLKVLGEWPTLYEGLSKLPPKIQKSWFDFDHFYSDNAFPEALPIVFENKPKKLLDIGGNTGKWTAKCLAHNADVNVTIMDLPGQLEMAKNKLEAMGYGNRVSFHACNLLDESQPFAKGFDIIWMSQFLDCFSEDQIVSILSRCHDALNEGGKVIIMETFWDRQKYESSAFSLQQTSLYFTTMANGNSQMYNSNNFYKCVEKAGFKVLKQVDLGISHTLLECVPMAGK